MIIFTDFERGILPPVQLIENIIAKYNPKAIYLREKGLSNAEYCELAMQIMPVCEHESIDLYVCHRIDIAKKLGIKNLHLSLADFEKIANSKKIQSQTLQSGQPNLNISGPSQKQQILWDDSKIGAKCEFNNISISIHSVEEVDKVQDLGATNLVFGHIFETNCKAGLEPRGLERLQEICNKSNIPVVAIGGINRQNVGEVLSSGVADFAIMSSAMTLTF